jgi:SprB repeat
MQSCYSRLISLLAVIGLFFSCSQSDVDKKIDCAQAGLTLSLLSKNSATGCATLDGSLKVNASGGTAPYSYSLNGGKYQANNEFLNIGAGSYTVSLKDVNGCTKSLQVEITSPTSTLDATTVIVQNNQCNPPNGSVTITGKGGKSPYVYLLGIGGFAGNNIFSNLKEGIYNIIVKDADDCQKLISVTVPRINTSTSYINDIKPIITNACALPLCHDAAQGARDWTTYDKVKANASNIKTRTGNKSMPIGSGPKLTQDQINLIACWVDDGAANN